LVPIATEKKISIFMIININIYFRKRDNRKASRPLFHCHIAAEKTLRAATTEKTGNPYSKVHSLALADPSASPARRQAIAGHQAEEYGQCLCLILANELKVARVGLIDRGFVGPTHAK
jgi:hypothetical protein